MTTETTIPYLEEPVYTTQQGCSNGGFYLTYEDAAAQNGNCSPIDPCVDGLTLWLIQPCSVEDPYPPQEVVAVVAPPVPNDLMLPETGLSAFWVGFVLLACALTCGGLWLRSWARKAYQ